jgi:acyl-CoA reductase-like NAD-dependent aldehyde dehydrogenase
VTSPTGGFLPNAALGSRKDVRDAVRAARGAFGRWSRATPYNRGQILYRIAEMMEGRRDQFIAEVRRAEGDDIDVGSVVDESIDRWVWYAGWADKIAQVYGATNAVAAPYLNLSTPEPVGVVGILAPPRDSLLGLVSVLAPVIVTGNTAVLLAAEHRPLPAVTLAEVLATSDLPAGVVNVLTGRPAEMAPWLAGHGDVDALDLTGVEDESLRTELERAAAENFARVPRLPAQWHTDPGTGRMTAFLEVKTVWHPRDG